MLINVERSVRGVLTLESQTAMHVKMIDDELS